MSEPAEAEPYKPAGRQPSPDRPTPAAPSLPATNAAFAQLPSSIHLWLHNRPISSSLTVDGRQQSKRIFQSMGGPEGPSGSQAGRTARATSGGIRKPTDRPGLPLKTRAPHRLLGEFRPGKGPVRRGSSDLRMIKSSLTLPLKLNPPTNGIFQSFR